MSIKRFCDGCGDEIERSFVTNRYTPVRFFGRSGTGHNIKAEVMVAIDGTWNKGELCFRCLRELLLNGDLLRYADIEAR